MILAYFGIQRKKVHAFPAAGMRMMHRRQEICPPCRLSTDSQLPSKRNIEHTALPPCLFCATREGGRRSQRECKNVQDLGTFCLRLKPDFG